MRIINDDRMVESLAAVCALLESGGVMTDEALEVWWHRWLWDTPCNASLSEQCGDMNMNQGIPM